MLNDVSAIFKDAQEDETVVKELSYTEFLAATFDRERCVSREVVQAAFSMFDKDGSGSISMQELTEGNILGYMTAEELNLTLEALDTDGDKSLDFDEFFEMMTTIENG